MRIDAKDAECAEKIKAAQPEYTLHLVVKGKSTFLQSNHDLAHLMVNATSIGEGLGYGEQAGTLLDIRYPKGGIFATYRPGEGWGGFYRT